jgi:hypothetical protein
MKKYANLAALTCASVLTMATLKGSGGNSYSVVSTDLEFYTDGRHITIDIGPKESRLEAIGHDGPIFLGLGVYYVDRAFADLPRWAMDIEDEGETFFIDGGFSFGGEIHTEDDGTFGDLSAEIGRLCTAEDSAEDSAEDCLPCNINEGCSFRLDLSVCHSRGDEMNRAFVTIQDEDGEPIGFDCPKGEPQEPCRGLEGWLVIEHTEGEVDLCE